ncbi:hypothetical protein LCGC14_1704560 [marine sediment metagenome]|uniref:Uncharacterized protein n=1 Tax=marine sediment metagenome TaxID=412755 RepID=A0A0F9I4K2_9ZZZZ
MSQQTPRRFRNVVTLSHIDPGLHQWLKDEAQRRTDKTGTRVTMTELIGSAIAEFRAGCESEEEPVGAGEKVGHAT